MMLSPLLYLFVFITLPGAAVAKICTVTGPTVIDFQGFLNNVADRCAYSLISDLDAGVDVFASFLERRRRDVSFVDSVTLSVGGGDNIVLQQGGRVLVNGAVVSLNRTVQNFFGIGIYEDATGVTTKQITSEYNVTVFFDGTTAQIYTEVPDSSALTGLCVDSSNVPSGKLPGDSLPSCTDQFQDPADSSINCGALTTRCNLLQDPLISSCNADVDPTPYINACKETLCKYSEADNLGCEFMQAYARACSLNAHVVPDSWWRKTRCSNTAFCQGTSCTANEFCGRAFTGQTTCLCRAVFAYEYRQSGALGEPTVCSHNTASVSLLNCLLVERGIDYTNLHLNNQSCRGELLEQSNTVTFTFSTRNPCGAEITHNNNQINYTNAIMSQNSTDLIVRHDHVFLEFSCFNTQPELRSVSFRVKHNSFVSTVKSGEWTYNVSMTPYVDEACSKVVATDTDVKLDQTVWVELKTKGLDAETIAMVTESCWATGEPNPDSPLRYDLIVDGCANPDDGTVHVKRNGAGTSNRFSFNMFEFTRRPENVYLHCQLQLCLRKDGGCVPVCPSNKRRRRFAKPKYSQGEAAFISMGWGK